MNRNPLPVRWMFLAGGALLVVPFLLSVHNTAYFLRSYLFAFLFWSDLPLGALGLVMIYHLTGGQWGALSRRILEAISATMLFVSLMFIPVIIGMARIYPWMDPAVASDPKIFHKRFYLNFGTFVLRAVIYFASWIIMERFLYSWSEAEEKNGAIENKARLRALSGGGIVWLGFSVSFAVIDWQMSVEARWYSTVYGMVYAVGQGLTAFAFALMVLGVAVSRAGLKGSVPRRVYRDLGNILLTLVMVWAYLSFVQYLIIWSGNLPHEVTWFTRRTSGGWEWLGLLLLLFQFALPFFLLLFRPAKHEASRLAIFGVVLFLVRIVDHYWMLMPGFGYAPFDLMGLSFAVWFGMGLLWTAVFSAKLFQKPVFASRDVDWPVPAAVMKDLVYE